MTGSRFVIDDRETPRFRVHRSAMVDPAVLAEERDASAAIDAVVAVLPEAWQSKVTRRLEAGDAGPMIVWVAEHEHSDLIVAGSHGHGVLKRLVMGSVSKHVMNHATCPVLLVRAPSD